jgi:hypothetical protein
MNCNECAYKVDCQYLNSDSGDLRYIVGDNCKYFVLDESYALSSKIIPESSTQSDDMSQS